MSNIKKIIGIVLALVMVLSMVSVAFAADAEEPAYSIRFEVVNDKTEIEPTDYTEIEVKLTTNFYASAISIPVFFDGSKVTVDASTTLPNSNIADENSKDVEKFYESVEHTPDTAALRALVYIAPYRSEIKKYNDETVMTLKVTANEDATSGEVKFDCIEDAIKTTQKPSGALYVSMNPYNLEVNPNWEEDPRCDALPVVVDDATITDAIAIINIKANDVVNTLKVKDDAPVTPYIDYTNGESAGYTAFIYGIDTLGWNDDFTPDATLDECLTTTLGDDYLVIEDVGGNETTGTIIKVLDADGDTVLETYVFIYFGDVDMDGSIGFSDAFMCEYYEMNYEGFDTLYQFMAGDLDGDGMPGLSDAYFCEYYEMNYEGMPSQAEVAALAYDIPYEIF